jgi:hypothetical protein
VTAKTKRRVFIALVVAALALPAETILLKALSSPTAEDAAHAWVSGLSAGQRIREAGRIQSYPFAYRRALMGVLTPDMRSTVWKAHIYAYIQTHADVLDDDALAALEAAAAAASPETFDAPSAASRAQAAAVAVQVEARLGREVAEYLLYRLGPKDGQAATIEPIVDKLAGLLRRTFVAMAFIEECDCNMEFGCGGGMNCKDTIACTVIETWPACGWWWNETCNGLCIAGLPGGG